MGAPKARPRTGLFSASGDYLWFALSNGLDGFKYPVLDLRRKVLTLDLLHASSVC